jgi:hypothetical protein
MREIGMAVLSSAEIINLLTSFGLEVQVLYLEWLLVTDDITDVRFNRILWSFYWHRICDLDDKDFSRAISLSKM